MKNSKMVKFISMAIAALMIASMLPVMTFADDTLITAGWSADDIKASIAVGVDNINNAYKAFDGDTGSTWEFEDKSKLDTYYVTIDLGANYNITRFKINSWNGNVIPGYKIQISPTGLTADDFYDVIIPKTNNKVAYIDERCNFVGRYVRLHITDASNRNERGNKWCGLTEVEYYGSQTSAAVTEDIYDLTDFRIDTPEAMSFSSRTVTEDINDRYGPIDLWGDKYDLDGTWNFIKEDAYMEDAGKNGTDAYWFMADTKVVQSYAQTGRVTLPMSGNLGNLSNFSRVEISYASNFRTQLAMASLARGAQDVWTQTDKVYLPSTNGEWGTATFTIDEFNADWLYSGFDCIFSEQTQQWAILNGMTLFMEDFNGTADPMLSFKLNGVTFYWDSPTVGVSNIQAYDAATGEYVDALSANGTILDVILENNQDVYARNTVVAAALYDNSGKLVDISVSKMNIPARVVSDSATSAGTAQLSFKIKAVSNPGNYTLKLLTWDDAGVPYTKSVEIF